MITPRTSAVQWKNEACVLLDQTRLPSEEIYNELIDYRDVVADIRRLAVRGAPAIGIAGAFAVVLALREMLSHPLSDRRSFIDRAFTNIENARPTAVNLAWAVRRMQRLLADANGLGDAAYDRALNEARLIHDDDIRSNQMMAELGAALFPEDCEVITYCNTGDLATGGVGTAFGVIHEGFRQGKVKKVYPCETRPVLQGARLTVWELQKNGIPYSLICDNMAGLTLRDRKIGAVLVGADRIARNGDAANKVGTYSLAVLARHHKVPFYVVAPSSTFDLSIATGAEIPIEERHPEEILKAMGANQPPYEVPVNNPSFDVTPHELITAIICEAGVFNYPYGDLRARLDRQG